MTSLSEPAERPKSSLLGLLLGFFLWITAITLMFGAIVYQRTTGPTYPYRGSFTAGAEEHSYKLIRSKETTSDAIVALPDPGPDAAGVLYWRRYPLQEEYTPVPLTRDMTEVLAAAPSDEHEGIREDLEGKIFAPLPKQPSAGKLEYYVEFRTGVSGSSEIRIPTHPEDDPDAENIVIRYKDPVPSSILWPHVLFMFFSVLIGIRAGLSAIVQPRMMRAYAWTALIGMSIGGMVLGPIVQKYAFGAYWTGFPWGYDLTDNKMLIMWIVWIVGCSTIGLRAKAKEGIGRFVIICAMIVMMGVYLIPHSMRGSELDYEKLDSGVAPHEAIGTGDK